ncbi:MAG: thioredoxin family protein [Planctomycetes bacterium]|nr:thioredoxin family protein [Planctomycetota bacterium]
MRNKKLVPGDRAPDFELPGVDGRTHNLAGLLKKFDAVVVMFSCNHCPYVIAYQDRFNEIQNDYSLRGATIVAINPNNEISHPTDSFGKMKERALEQGFEFPYLRDESQSVAAAYGAEFTPEVFLVDKAGIVRYVGRIDDNYQNASAVKSHDLRNALDKVLAGETGNFGATTAIGCTIKWK